MNLKKALRQTINDASTKNEKLGESIQTAGTTKTELDKSTELAGDAKTELDTSVRNAGTAKTALDTSISEATAQKQALDTTVEQAGEVNTSLSEKISDAGQILNSVTQIETNTEDIGSLKEEMSRNVLNDAKTKRSLEALWKLNQGIAYQFETDTEMAYQKEVPSGAKLASVKKIGGKTIVWNQIFKIALTSANGLTSSCDDDGLITINGTSTSYYTVFSQINDLQNKEGKFFVKMTVIENPNNVAFRFGYSNRGKFTDIISSGSTSKIFTQTKEELVKGKYQGLQGFQEGTVFDNVKVKIMICDLTKMFGSGNEPSTPEEFEAMFPNDYYPYNEGALMSMPVNEVVEWGRNLWSFGSKLKFRGVAEYKISAFEEKRVITLKYNYPNGYGAGTGKPCIVCLDKNNQDLNSKYIDRSVVIPVGTEKIRIYSNGYNYNDSKEVDVVLTDIQLEKGTTATTYSPYHKNTYPIPQAILNLDSYGDGVSDDVYNYVDWENKEYHKRVGRVDLGSLTWFVTKSGKLQSNTIETARIAPDDIIANCVCSLYEVCSANTVSNGTKDKVLSLGINHNAQIFLLDSSYIDATSFKETMQGVMLYYELAEEEIIDISDIIDNTFQEPIEVEAGGTLTFQNSNGDGYRLPVPNEEEYIVSLAEVGGGGASE